MMLKWSVIAVCTPNNRFELIPLKYFLRDKSCIFNFVFIFKHIFLFYSIFIPYYSIKFVITIKIY